MTSSRQYTYITVRSSPVMHDSVARMTGWSDRRCSASRSTEPFVVRRRGARAGEPDHLGIALRPA